VEAVGAFALAQRFFFLPYGVPGILAGIVVAGGALWLTQLAWISRWQGILLAVSAVLGLGLFAFIGRRDWQAALILLTNGRLHRPQGAA